MRVPLAADIAFEAVMVVIIIGLFASGMVGTGVFVLAVTLANLVVLIRRILLRRRESRRQALAPPRRMKGDKSNLRSRVFGLIAVAVACYIWGFVILANRGSDFNGFAALVAGLLFSYAAYLSRGYLKW